MLKRNNASFTVFMALFVISWISFVEIFQTFLYSPSNPVGCTFKQNKSRICTPRKLSQFFGKFMCFNVEEKLIKWISLKNELQDQLIKVNFLLPNFTESHQTKCSNICSQFCFFVFMLISLRIDRFLSLYADYLIFGLFILFLVVRHMHCRYLCYFNEVV